MSENVTKAILKGGPKIVDMLFAINGCDIEEIRRLLDVGYEVDRPDNKGHTALHSAAQKGDVAICRLLIERGSVGGPSCDLPMVA